MFRVPVTVLQPQPLSMSSAAAPQVDEKDVLFKPSTIKRHIIVGESSSPPFITCIEKDPVVQMPFTVLQHAMKTKPLIEGA